MGIRPSVTRMSRRTAIPALLTTISVFLAPATVFAAEGDGAGRNPCAGVTSDVAQLQPPDNAASRRLQAQVATPITDGHGYTITTQDAWFFGMTGAQLANWRSRRAPLTLSPAEFNTFVHEFYAAAAADGLDGKLDIRLKGSSAGFWSNPMKAMPRDAEEAAELYQSKKKAWPSKAWCANVAKRFAQWLGPDRVGDKDAVPTYRPFNALFTLGILDDKSDVDVQVSSDQAAAKIDAVCAADNISPCQDKAYGFYRKTPTFKALPAMTAMMDRWAQAFALDFTYAVFPSRGPDNYLSSFRPTDWILSTPCTYLALNDTAPKTPLSWQAPGLQTCPLITPMPSSAVKAAVSAPLPPAGDPAWASEQSGGAQTGRALLESVLQPSTLERVAQVEAIVSASTPTDKMFSDGKGNWSAQRTALHDRILDRAWAAAVNVPSDHRAVYAGGLPGAGKTTFLASDAARAQGIDLDDYLIINPDDMKALLIATPDAVPDYPGLKPSETASLIHAESSYLSDELLTRALAAGKNVLIDRTMGAAKPVAATFAELKRMGYKTTSVYVDSTPAESLARSEYRYRGKHGDFTGRPVAFTSLANTPLDALGRTPNRVVFEAVAAPASDTWILVDHHRLGASTIVATGAR